MLRIETFLHRFSFASQDTLNKKAKICTRPKQSVTTIMEFWSYAEISTVVFVRTVRNVPILTCNSSNTGSFNIEDK